METHGKGSVLNHESSGNMQGKGSVLVPGVDRVLLHLDRHDLDADVVDVVGLAAAGGSSVISLAPPLHPY